MPRPNPIKTLQHVARILTTQQNRLLRMCESLEHDTTRNSLLTGEDLRSYKKATAFANRMIAGINKMLAISDFEGVIDVAKRKSRGRPSNDDYAQAEASRSGRTPKKATKRKAAKTAPKRKAAKKRARRK